jgi:peptide/nickel transport system permease protein
VLHYVVRRVLLLVPVLVGASLVIFLLLRLLPGDVADVLMGTDEISDAVQRQIRERLGLYDPVHVQYGKWLWGMLQGDLGISMRTGQPVASMILGRLPITFQIALMAIVVSTLVAVPLGVLSALYPDGWIDAFARVFAMIGLAVPNFLVATLLILVTSLYLQWYTEPFWVNPFHDPLGSLRQMALPVIALSTSMMAIITRMTRSSMLEVLRQDYIRTARAKGLFEGEIIGVHALKNAFIPVLTVIGLQLGNLLAGTVIIEQIFALPGVGWLLLNGVYQRDYTVIQGTVFFITFMYALVNLVVDMLYVALDPRIRYG